MPNAVPVVENKNKTKILPQWHVILHNTDFHTVEWVITLIMTIFDKDFDEAYALTMKIHKEGMCIAMTTHKERAEMYKEKVHGFGCDPNASGPQVPLPCTIEPAD